MTLCGSRKFTSFPQMSDALPTILTCPSWDKLKDSVDRVSLFGRPLLNRSDEQLIDGRQLLAGLIARSSLSPGHCATSLQEDQCREIASRDAVKFIGREAYSRTIQSEVGCGYQRGATFVVPHFFPLDEGAPEPQLGRGQAESAFYNRAIVDAVRGRLAVGLLKRRCSISCLLPHIY
jgi:hypothetical protein